tara:strand:- start:309 stop:818 length:510 start_codon:yes stop_codon:yes gene_type:complete
MIKLKDLLFEFKNQLFTPQGGQIDLTKIPKGKLRVSSWEHINKPKGAFWTSTHNTRGSDWVDFAKYGFDWGDKLVSALLLKSTGGKILHIKSDRDYEKAYEKYPATSKSSSSLIQGKKWLDWKSLGKKYDAVHISNSALYNDNLYGWDVESTAWFNMGKLKIDKVIDLN